MTPPALLTISPCHGSEAIRNDDDDDGSAWLLVISCSFRFRCCRRPSLLLDNGARNADVGFTTTERRDKTTRDFIFFLSLCRRG